MKISWKRALPGTGFILSMAMMLCACSTPAVRNESLRMTSDIRNILILPFHDVSRLYEPNINVRCYLCGQVMTTGFVPDSAGPFLTSELVSLMEKDGTYAILSSEGSTDLLSGMKPSGPDNMAVDQYLNLYIDTGKRAGADAVLIGHIFRFVERKGNRASVESPASVSFDLHLIHVGSGRIVWTGHFDQTQRPLSENVLEIGTFFKRGASWITAEELAQSGLENIVRSFPKP
jgi:hypothetical protein